MDIIISANEKILAIIQALNKPLPVDMSEGEYKEWLNKTINSGKSKIKNTKKSQFNYVSSSQKGHLIYNTLYNSLTRLSEEEYCAYLLEEYSNASFIDQLVSQGILVDKKTDELEQYNRYAQYAVKYISHRPNITVTPTMECNARCFYCYEEGVRHGKMRKEDCAGIIKFLNTMDCSQGIDLTWFGGEPLMNQEWMDCFSESLEAAGIEFSSFIITNGSKINDDTIDKMINKWKIKFVQITLDGCIDEYTARKAYMDQDETIYYRILRTIGKLSKAGIDVKVRMNVDGGNIDSILKAVENLAYLYKSDCRVKCYPAFITGTNKPLSEADKVAFIKRMIDVGNEVLNVNDYLYRLPRTHACYYNQKNAYSIDVTGNIFICEHMLGYDNQAVGNINSGLKNNEREVSGRRTECQKCVFLPKCQGGCMHSLRHSEVPCFTDKYIIKAYLDLM